MGLSPSFFHSIFLRLTHLSLVLLRLGVCQTGSYWDWAGNLPPKARKLTFFGKDSLPEGYPSTWVILDQGGKSFFKKILLKGWEKSRGFGWIRAKHLSKASRCVPEEGWWVEKIKRQVQHKTNLSDTFNWTLSLSNLLMLFQGLVLICCSRKDRQRQESNNSKSLWIQKVFTLWLIATECVSSLLGSFWGIERVQI